VPEAVARQPRRDDTAADAKTLEQLGRIEPQPVPAPIEPEPAPDDDKDAVTLRAALLDAGITATAEDHAAVTALAQLDPATVEAVTRWVTAKEPNPEKQGGAHA
jgi:hypothetical protein